MNSEYICDVASFTPFEWLSTRALKTTSNWATLTEKVNDCWHVPPLKTISTPNWPTLTEKLNDCMHVDTSTPDYKYARLTTLIWLRNWINNTVCECPTQNVELRHPNLRCWWRLRRQDRWREGLSRVRSAAVMTETAREVQRRRRRSRAEIRVSVW